MEGASEEMRLRRVGEHGLRKSFWKNQEHAFAAGRPEHVTAVWRERERGWACAPAD